LEATFVPLAGRSGCFFAAVRRALAHQRSDPARFFPSRGYALWIINWDSNAVLCGTWQIPDANTSANPKARRKKRRFTRSGTDFCDVPHFKWIMGRACTQAQARNAAH
jgi:hypothetical protein